MHAPLLAVLGIIVGLVGADEPAIMIAGGQNAFPGQYPWMVSVEATNFQEGWPLCAGTLVNPEWVLTAAHCLDSEKPDWLWVVTGETQRGVDEGPEQYLYVDYFVQHPDYTYWLKPYFNDVALIHLTTPAILDSYTTFAPMPDQAGILTGPCWEAGWGATAEGASGTEMLQYAQIDLLDNAQCNAVYNSPDPNSLCAGEMAGGVGACVGDNGGGLMCVSTDGSVVVGGVMSYREGCARPGVPAVYMDIAKYRGWIANTIGSYHKLKPTMNYN